MTWLDVRPRLFSYTNLKPNWDSYGAEPPTLETIGLAGRWAALLEMCGANAPNNVASLGNGIEFEYQDHVIEFFNDGRVVSEIDDGTKWVIAEARA